MAKNFKNGKNSTAEPLPENMANKKLSSHYGFTEYIYSAQETYPDGTVIDVDYFGKKL